MAHDWKCKESSQHSRSQWTMSSFRRKWSPRENQRNGRSGEKWLNHQGGCFCRTQVQPIVHKSVLWQRLYKVEFAKDECFVKDKKSTEIVLSPRRRKNMYVVDWETTKPIVCFIAKTKSNLSWEWHNKLNHLNFKALNKLVRKELVEGLPNMVYSKDRVCEACQKRKQIKSSFKSKSMESSYRPLSLLHVDLFQLIQWTSVRENIL